MKKMKFSMFSAVILILTAIVSQQGQAEPIEAGPIWSDDEAKTKCPEVCSGKGMAWEGQWNTTIPGQMSVCECTVKVAKNIEAGPIWSDDDARIKCPQICSSQGMVWEGQWNTTIPGEMSVCECKSGAAPVIPQQTTQPELPIAPPIQPE